MFSPPPSNNNCLNMRTSLADNAADYSQQHERTSDHRLLAATCLKKSRKTSDGRERRARMRQMLAQLRSSFLPNQASKDKIVAAEKVVAETIDLIKRLEQDKSRLEEQMKKLQQARSPASVNSLFAPGSSSSSFSSSVVTGVCMSDDAVLFEISCPRRRRTTLTELLAVFERRGAEILTASVVVKEAEGVMVVSVTAAVVDADTRSQVVGMIRRDLLDLPGLIFRD